MILGKKGVKYGLEVRQPKQANVSKKDDPKTSKIKNVFGDSDSEDEFEGVGEQIARQAVRKESDKKVGCADCTERIDDVFASII